MTTCSGCGTQYKFPAAKFCSNCGAPNSSLRPISGPPISSVQVAPEPASSTPIDGPVCYPNPPAQGSPPAGVQVNNVEPPMATAAVIPGATSYAYGASGYYGPLPSASVAPAPNYGYPGTPPTGIPVAAPVANYAYGYPGPPPVATPAGMSTLAAPGYGYAATPNGMIQTPPAAVNSTTYVYYPAQVSNGSGANPLDSKGFPLPWHRFWRADICDCLSQLVPNCLMASFFPCITYAQINARLGLRTYQTSLFISFGLWVGILLFSSLEEASANGPDFWAKLFRLLTILCTGIWVLFTGLQRRAVRKILHLPGSKRSDCWCTICCNMCSLAQLATQTGSYKPGECNFAAPPLAPR